MILLIGLFSYCLRNVGLAFALYPEFLLKNEGKCDFYWNLTPDTIITFSSCIKRQRNFERAYNLLA